MPSNDPEKRQAYKRKWRELNRDRERQMAAARRASDPERFRADDRKKAARYRSRHPDRARAAGRRSAGLPEPTRSMPEFCECGCGRKAIVLDHDHVTGKFRGWLSKLCNTGIGALGDDLASAERAVAYLKRAQ